METQLKPVEFVNTEAPDVIELKNVCQSYDGGKTNVLDNVNCLIESNGQGKVIAIVGRSGCGKSTILRYISGIQTPTSGQVLINGQEKHIEKVGMVFQKYSSLPWLTVEENVALGLKIQGTPKKERTEFAKQMIDQMKLAGHEEKYAQYPTLSGGQLQRIAIARSLLTDAKIMLMDEPFGALDVSTRARLQLRVNKIREAVKDMTIIFVTHDVEEAVFVADEVLIMRANPGQIVGRIHTFLPIHRDLSLKRSKEFLDKVYDIQDILVSLDGE